MNQLLQRYFKLAERQTTVQQEVLAGTTTFVSMAYILFVNPSILSLTGMDPGAIFTATAVSAIVGSVLMALWANFPFAVAPGMGDNTFFAFSIVLAMGIPWETGLAALVVASLLIMLLSMTKFSEVVIDAVPLDLKLAMAAGIGIYIAFIGLQGSGLVLANDSSMVEMGSLLEPTVWISLVGLIVTAMLMARKVPGSIFIGMIIAICFGLAIGQIQLPEKMVAMPASLMPTLNVGLAHLGDLTSLKLWAVILVYILIVFFDTAGTLFGLGSQAGLVRGDKLPGMQRALTVNAGSTLLGSVLGTTPTAAYVESSAGIAVGGRTGLTALVSAGFFGLSLFFSPLLVVVTGNVTGPVLIIIGVLMAQSLQDIQWEAFELAFPAFMIIIGMSFTANIANGIAFGFVVYPMTMLAAGRRREISPVMWTLFVIFTLLLIILNVL